MIPSLQDVAPERPTALPHCLYCDATEWEPWLDAIHDRLGHVPGEWAFQRCLSCRSVRLAPFPHRAQLAGFYPPAYNFVATTEQHGVRRFLGRLEQRWFYQRKCARQARTICGALGTLPVQPQLLDIGCGRGHLLRAFQQLGFAVQGLEFQEADAAHVQSELEVPVYCADTEQLGEHIPAASLDVITAWYVLEHLPDVTATLRSCWQCLRPGGWLAAAVPLADSRQAQRWGRRWAQFTEAPRHLSLPSHAGLRRLCERTGFVCHAIIPESPTCSESFSVSLLPGACHANGQKRHPLTVGLLRVLAGFTLVLARPWCWIENHCFKQPACGILLARKPG